MAFTVVEVAAALELSIALTTFLSPNVTTSFSSLPILDSQSSSIPNSDKSSKSSTLSPENFNVSLSSRSLL